MIPQHPLLLATTLALVPRSDLLDLFADYVASEPLLRLEISKQWPDLHLGPGYSCDQGQDKSTLGFNLTLPIFDQNQGLAAEEKQLASLENALADLPPVFSSKAIADFHHLHAHPLSS